MNYALVYERLVCRAKGRVLSGYFEKHHVIPKCLGGLNEEGNIVRLTAREPWHRRREGARLGQGIAKWLGV